MPRPGHGQGSQDPCLSGHLALSLAGKPQQPPGGPSASSPLPATDSHTPALDPQPFSTNPSRSLPNATVLPSPARPHGPQCKPWNRRLFATDCRLSVYLSVPSPSE